MVSKEEIVELNKRIIGVSGTEYDFFGIINGGNLDYAIGLADSQTNPIEQATTFMYEITRGQPFTNANKRTGFEIGKGVVVSGGYLFNASENEIIDFTEKINTEGKSREEVNEWIASHSKMGGEKGDFLTMSGANVIKDAGMLKKMD